LKKKEKKDPMVRKMALFDYMFGKKFKVKGYPKQRGKELKYTMNQLQNFKYNNYLELYMAKGMDGNEAARKAKIKTAEEMAKLNPERLLSNSAQTSVMAIARRSKKKPVKRKSKKKR
jgi:hypothetical protein